MHFWMALSFLFTKTLSIQQGSLQIMLISSVLSLSIQARHPCIIRGTTTRDKRKAQDPERGLPWALVKIRLERHNGMPFPVWGVHCTSTRNLDRAVSGAAVACVLGHSTAGWPSCRLFPPDRCQRFRLTLQLTSSEEPLSQMYRVDCRLASELVVTTTPRCGDH